MKKIIFLFFVISSLFLNLLTVNAEELSYSAHVQNIGWFDIDYDQTIGTTGRGFRLEAFVINKDDKFDGYVSYRSYVEGAGWQDYVSSGNISGTVGQAKKIEMIQIKLDGNIKENYDIYYRVHVSNIGWLDWACNDQVTGTFGYRNQIEAIQIKIIKKGDVVPINTSNIYKEKSIKLSYQSYFDNNWGDIMHDGDTSGTVGKSISISAFRVVVDDNLGDWVQYRSYHSGKWDDYVFNNNVSGMLKSNEYIEMIQMKLSSEVSKIYDLCYRVHVSNVGWLDWACNDQITGTLGYGYKIEAIEIKLIKKDQEHFSGNNIYMEKQNYLSYSTHIQDYGWTNYVYSSNVLGKCNSKKRLEAIQIKLNNLSVSGNIKYSSHVEGIGWQDYVNSNEISGSVGKARRLEAVKIELEGDISNLYDIYYRTCVEDFGWLDWAKNGEISGSVSIAKKMEAIEIRLVEKNSSAPGDTNVTYVNSVFKVDGDKVYYYENGKKVTGFKVVNGIKYFFNSDGVLISKKVKKIIDVSVYQGDIDWNKVKNTDVDGAILRLGYGTSYTTDACVMDKKFERNYNASKNLGLLYGLYLYSYAIDTTSASIEGNFVLEKLKKYNVSKDITIYYDLEENDWTTNLSKSKYHDIVSTFSKILEKDGYKVKVYSYKYWAENRLDSFVNDKLDWIAQYSNYCTYFGSYKGWQYTSSGKVDGISGDVDISVFV